MMSIIVHFSIVDDHNKNSGDNLGAKSLEFNRIYNDRRPDSPKVAED